jgi:HK97 family phage prohead protease
MRQTMFEKKTSGSGRECRSFAFEIKIANDNGEIEGYGSVFGVKDSYDDVVEFGAFASSLAQHRAANTMPAMLWQHDPNEPIGVWTEMFEDSGGLRVRGKLALDTVRGKETFALMKMGAFSGLSIGFVAKDWKYDRTTEVRTLTNIDLWEVSLVTFPANAKARITSIRSVSDLAKPSDAERWLRDAAPEVSKSEATAFVSLLMRMGEERREAAQSTAQAQAAANRLLRSLS